MTDKFTDSMEVTEVGDLRPSSIFDGCLGCRYSRDPIRGVLIEGITPEAARMLYKQCEVVPTGTTAEIKWLKSINSDLLEAIEALIDNCESLKSDGEFFRFEKFNPRVIERAFSAIRKAKGIPEPEPPPMTECSVFTTWLCRKCGWLFTDEGKFEAHGEGCKGDGNFDIEKGENQ